MRGRRCCADALERRVLLATYTGTAGIDNYLVRPQAGGGGGVEVLLNNTVIDTQPSPVSPMVFNLGGGNDTLTVAASVSASITMNGQGGSDALVLQSSLADVTFISNPTATAAEDSISASAGSVQFPGTIDLLSLNLSGSSSATLAASGAYTLYTGALTIGASAKLDLNDNDLVTPGASATTLQNWIISGFGGGSTGIASTAGEGTGGACLHVVIDSTLAGVSVWPINSGHTILGGSNIVHYEIFGDANLDHLVSGDDYTIIDSNLNTTPPLGYNWLSGDVNLDDIVTGDDYITIDSNLGLRNTTPPAVTLGAPAANATLSGSVSVSASASDINGVASVQFLLDGVTLGAEDATSPYSISWNTTTASAGTHTLSARASDLAGNVSTSAPVTVFVDNSIPIHLVQNATNGFESNTTSISRAFPSSNTAGNCLIVTGTAARSAQNTTISDTLGNIYVLALSATDPTQNVTANIWYCANAKAGANTVTIRPTDGAGHAMEIHISEWSGVSKTAPLDKSAWATGAGTAVSSGAASPTQNGELAFGYAFVGLSATAGTGFTQLGLINGDLDEYQIQGAAAAVAATFTQSGADAWLAMMVTFKRDA